MGKKKIPKRLQAILWSADIKDLDLQKHKGYIIHQVFRYGTLKDINWLFQVYPKHEILDVFIHHPRKTYERCNFYFVKDYILGLRNINLIEDAYVTSIHGQIRLRKATGF